MLVSEAPIASRSAASPVTNRCSSAMSVSDSCLSRSSTVPSTALRLSMVRPMTASRSASVDGQRRGVAEQRVDVPPSPCSVLMISIANCVDVLRVQRREQRLEAVEQHGEVERRLGLRAAGWCRARRAARPDAGALGERDVALPDQVAVADLRAGC